jgi:hypothetical protein
MCLFYVYRQRDRIHHKIIQTYKFKISYKTNNTGNQVPAEGAIIKPLKIPN